MSSVASPKYASPTETPYVPPTPVSPTTNRAQVPPDAQMSGQAARADDEAWGTESPSGGVCHLALRYRRATHPVLGVPAPSGAAADERLPCHLAARVAASAGSK